MDRPGWSAAQLDALRTAHELRIAGRRPDGSLRDPVPIWVVVRGTEVLVRTWTPRDTGWYGLARRSGRARAQVLGEDVDVRVEAVGEERATEVDDAYRAKYGAAGAGSMTTPAAVSSTLRLTPEQG